MVHCDGGDGATLDELTSVGVNYVAALKDGKVTATVDFGDGTCDDKGTKTVDGKTVEITLKQKKKRGKPEKDKSKSSEKS